MPKNGRSTLDEKLAVLKKKQKDLVERNREIKKTAKKNAQLALGRALLAKLESEPASKEEYLRLVDGIKLRGQEIKALAKIFPEDFKATAQEKKPRSPTAKGAAKKTGKKAPSSAKKRTPRKTQTTP